MITSQNGHDYGFYICSNFICIVYRSHKCLWYIYWLRNKNTYRLKPKGSEKHMLNLPNEIKVSI